MMIYCVIIFGISIYAILINIFYYIFSYLGYSQTDNHFWVLSVIFWLLMARIAEVNSSVRGLKLGISPNMNVYFISAAITRC